MENTETNTIENEENTIPETETDTETKVETETDDNLIELDTNSTILNPDLLEGEDITDLPNEEGIPPIVTEGERMPDNPSEISIFIPIRREEVTKPSSFTKDDKKYIKEKKIIWDFEHKEYSFFNQFRLEEQQSFVYFGNRIRVEKYVCLKDEFNKDISYIIFSVNGKVTILPTLIFYYKYEQIIKDTFIQTPSITFDKKRIVVDFEEDELYKLDCEIDGILADITYANTSGHYKTNLENPSELILEPIESIKFFIKNGQLYFKPLRPELNVITFKVVDKTYSKSVFETIIVRVNPQEQDFPEETPNTQPEETEEPKDENKPDEVIIKCPVNVKYNENLAHLTDLDITSSNFLLEGDNEEVRNIVPASVDLKPLKELENNLKNMEILKDLNLGDCLLELKSEMFKDFSDYAEGKVCVINNLSELPVEFVNFSLTIDENGKEIIKPIILEIIEQDSITEEIEETETDTEETEGE